MPSKEAVLRFGMLTVLRNNVMVAVDGTVKATLDVIALAARDIVFAMVVVSTWGVVYEFSKHEERGKPGAVG